MYQVVKQVTICACILLTAVLLLAACGERDGGRPPALEATPTTVGEGVEEAVPTAVPAQGTTILAEGKLTAANPQLPLAFAAGGRLLELAVAAGDRVEAGDLIGMLDDKALQDALSDAELGERQAQNSLAQAQLALDNLLDWEPDETAVAQAQAALAAAEASLENAQGQDSAAGNSVTAARISLEQAQRALQDAQEQYDSAYDPGREWELYIDDPSCRTGEQHPNCTGPPYSDIIENDRQWADRALPRAQDDLKIAQANYNLALAGLNSNSAVGAESQVAAAEQALAQALRGPQAEEIAAARLQVEQAQIALEQAQFARDKARAALADTRLEAPAAGTVIEVHSAPGGMVGAGTAVVTLLDTSDLLFETSNLSERDLAQVRPGLPAQVTLKAYPGEVLDGRVLRVAPLAEGTIGDAATFTVIVDLAPSDLDLLPGMTGRVEIEGQ
jgi:HlyD family secretion protein